MLSLSCPAHAKDKTVETVRELGVWQNEYSAIMVEVGNMFDINAINVIVEYAQSEDEGAHDKLSTAIEAWSIQLDNTISIIETRVNNFPKPPHISFSRKMNKAVKNQYSGLPAIVDDAIESALHMKTAFTRIGNGDESGVSAIFMAQATSAQNMILGEIAVLEANLLAIPDNNPNYFISKLSVTDDQFAWYEIEIFKLNLMGNSTLETRLPMIEKMKGEINKSEQYLRKGRIASPKFETLLKKYKEKDKARRKFYDDVLQAYETLTPSFNVEYKIIKLRKSSVKIYAKDISDDEIDEKIEEIDAQYLPLIDERVRIQMQRVSFIANAGK